MRCISWYRPSSEGPEVQWRDTRTYIHKCIHVGWSDIPVLGVSTDLIMRLSTVANPFKDTEFAFYNAGTRNNGETAIYFYSKQKRFFVQLGSNLLFHHNPRKLPSCVAVWDNCSTREAHYWACLWPGDLWGTEVASKRDVTHLTRAGGNMAVWTEWQNPNRIIRE